MTGPRALPAPKMTEAECACGCGEMPRKRGAEYVRGHRPPSDPVARFWSLVDKGEGCWAWKGVPGTHGYGRFWLPGERRIILAHRFAVSLREPLIPGMEVDHLCRNRLCVRPDHLEQVSPGENRRREMAARAPVTHCRRGHAYDEANTYVNAAGYRECRTCLRERGRSA